MSQTFQEILQDYGVWVAETTSSTRSVEAIREVSPERVPLQSPVSFQPSRLDHINLEESAHQNFEKGFSSPLHTYAPTEPLIYSSSYEFSRFSRTANLSFDPLEDEVASQTPSLTFSSSTLSPHRNIKSPITPTATPRFLQNTSSREIRSNSPQRTQTDHKSRPLNISFPIQQPCSTSSSTTGYRRHSPTEGTMDDASYEPKRPAPTPPTSSSFHVRINQLDETSFMNWDDSSSRLSRVTGVSNNKHLRPSLRYAKPRLRKQNSSHRHIVRHQASAEDFSNRYTERERPSRRVDHLHVSVEEAEHHYPHKRSAKSAENLLCVPDGNRHELERLNRHPVSVAKLHSRKDGSPHEANKGQLSIEAETGTAKFKGLVKTLITKLSQTSLRARAHEFQEDED